MVRVPGLERGEAEAREGVEGGVEAVGNEEEEKVFGRVGGAESGARKGRERGEATS